jgi:hypothetical protein
MKPIPKRTPQIEDLENKQEDRVWVTITRKVNLGNYEMMDLQFGASVSVLPEETLTKAFARVSVDVRKEHASFLKSLVDEIKR